jgi:hypothetical protein
MKKFKNFLMIALVAFSLSTVFVACSKDNATGTNNVVNSKMKLGMQSKTALGTGCSYINDNTPGVVTLTPTTLADLCSPNAQAIVSPGTTGSYKFIINDVLTSGQWSVYSGSGITFNGGSLTATGTSVTVNFAAGFTSGSIQVIGSDPTGQIYGPILNITKSNGTIDLCSCAPLFSRILFDAPNPYTGGPIKNSFQFENRSECAFDWGTVESVKVQIGGTFGVGSNSISVPNINFFGVVSSGNWANNNNWTSINSGFRNMKTWTHKNSSNVAPPYLMNNTMYNQPAWATIKFRNGCPDKVLYLNDDQEYSF